MTPAEFSALRERCFNLVNGALKEQYKPTVFDSLIDIMLLHQKLPDAPLVVATYQGIIGYHTWLQGPGRNQTSFLPDALHDLAECVQYNRHDGYSPRTDSYVQFYTPSSPAPNPDFTAYYFPEQRQLQVYAGTEQVLRLTVDEDDDETDYWQGFQYGGAEYDANLSRPGEESLFCLSIYPVENGQTQTGRSLPVTFSERKSPFHVGDKVRFTEEAIALVVRSFDSDEVSEFMTQVYRESEYIVEDISASPEYDHNIVTVRHSAEDDSRGIAEYNLIKE